MSRFSVILIGLSLSVLAGCNQEPEVKTYAVPKEGGAPPAATAPPAPTPAAAPTQSVSSETPAPSARGMTPLPGMAEQAAAFGTPTWDAPNNWHPQPLGSVRKGSWKIEGEGGQRADVSVTVFPGDVGGDLQNINRWRQQVGLGPIGPGELHSVMEHRDIGPVHAHVVSIDGPNGDSILGAIVPRGGGTWLIVPVAPLPGLPRPSATRIPLRRRYPRKVHTGDW